MIELTDEYKKLSKEFRKKFGYGVPLSMIPPTTTTEELIARIEDCINKGQDDLLQQYGVSDDDNILY